MEGPKKGLCRPHRGQWVNVNWVFMKLEADEKIKNRKTSPQLELDYSRIMCWLRSRQCGWKVWLNLFSRAWETVGLGFAVRTSEGVGEAKTAA